MLYLPSKARKILDKAMNIGYNIRSKSCKASLCCFATPRGTRGLRY